MGFWTQLILIIVVLHFVVGFGYLIYKLSPRKKDRPTDGPSNTG
jgi:hypothetical protein